MPITLLGSSVIPPAAPAGANTALPIVIVLALAIAVLVSIALDLRRLRKESKLRAIHSALGAAFTVIVIGGALAMTAALGSASSATAEQQDVPGFSVPEQAPEPETIDTSDIVDPATNTQLPTLAD